MKRSVLVGLAVIGLVAGAATRFEVASIRLANPSEPRGGRFGPPPINTTPGLLTARSATLQQLVQSAYELEDYQVSGGPPWIDTARFDVEARAQGHADRAELLLMLRGLPTARFGLVFHREKKPMAVYALTVAKSGPRFHAVTPGVELPPSDRFRPRSMPFLTRYLTHLGSDMPVIDLTGLTGDFDLALDVGKILMEVNQDGMHASAMFEPIVEALQEAGLQVARTRVPIETIVIDHAEKPVAN